MGCTQSKNIIPPNVSVQHINRLIQISNVNHQLNINVKYEYLSAIDQTKTVGQGLRKTFAYKCLTTRDQFVSKRKQFWETRSNGQPQCWRALNLATRAKSNDEVQNLLSKGKLTALNGSIQMCIDNRGTKYQLPVFVINEPLSYQHQRIADRNLTKNYRACDVKIKIRSVKYPNEDIELETNTSDEIELVKTMIRIKKGLKKCSIRLFYNGRQMHDHKTLGNYGFIDDTIIIAIIKD